MVSHSRSFLWTLSKSGGVEYRLAAGIEGGRQADFTTERAAERPGMKRTTLNARLRKLSISRDDL